MSYESKERACKRGNEVPRSYDYIEVMWCLDYLPGIPERWCTAELIHIAQSCDHGAIARGVIRYLPDDTWDEYIHKVEFLNHYKLQRSIDRFEEEDDSNGDEKSTTITP